VYGANNFGSFCAKQNVIITNLTFPFFRGKWLRAPKVVTC